MIIKWLNVYFVFESMMINTQELYNIFYTKLEKKDD